MFFSKSYVEEQVIFKTSAAPKMKPFLHTLEVFNARKHENDHQQVIYNDGTLFRSYPEQ